MLRKIWRTIKRGIIHFHHDERGDPETFAGIAAILSPAIAGATAPQEQPSYTEDPEYQKIAREWAEKMGKEYPEFPGMPGQVDTMGQRLTEMLGGELSPAVKQYLGYKYGQAWEKALPYYADIGAGPGTLASGQIKLGERQAIEGAYLGQQQIATGMQNMPNYTQMMLSPYMANVLKWGNISNLIGQNFPGAPYTAPGSAPTQGISPIKETMPAGLYGPAAEAWKAKHGYYGTY